MTLYFAYGSNMLAARLLARCPSARVMGSAVLPGHDIAFDKIGQDGSGKATLVGAPAASVPGVLFRLGGADLSRLDEIEGVGRGYRRARLSVRHRGAAVEACAYVAPEIWRDPGLLPFDWYLGLVYAGASEARLPSGWRMRLASFHRQSDPDATRPRRIEAEALLAACPADWRLS